MELIGDWIVKIAGQNYVLQGLVGGVIITLMNTFGALVVLLKRNVSDRFLDAALGFNTP